MARKKLAFITVILTYFLIVFGGYVASSESGMGCGPDWPLCNGEVIPELSGDTLIEFGHRVIGAVLYFLSLFLFLKIKKEKDQHQIRVGWWMLGLLTLQLVMGAIVVFYHLPSSVITIHLLIAMIFMAILIWFWRSPVNEFVSIGSDSNSPALKKHLNILVFLLFITIGIGAYVKHQHYGLACGVFECGNGFLPASIPEWLQTFHRFLAVLSTIYIVYFTYKVFSLHHNQLKSRMVLALIVILLQLLIGAMTILSMVSISFAVFHLAAATLLFAIIVEARMVVE